MTIDLLSGVKRGATVVRIAVIASIVATSAAGSQAATEPSAASIQRALTAAYTKYKDLHEGKNADYIPALAKVDPNLFGIALVTPDGHVYTAGDTMTQVSIQSISKVFTLARVLQDSGEKAIVGNIGVDATGLAFNSIVAIEQHKGHEMNPLVNAGAITMTSMVGAAARADLEQDPRHVRRVRRTQPDGARGRVQVRGGDESAQPRHRDAHVRVRTHSRQAGSGDRHLHAAVLRWRECARSRDDGGDARQRRRESGHASPNARRKAHPAGARRDGDRGSLRRRGQVAIRDGLPAKSGVGGGLIAVSPGNWGIAVISPPLDSAGNSVRGQKAIADISAALGGNPYGVRRITGAAAGEVARPPRR